ncbi:MAG TPA: response regulator transcription factor [Thermomicrobiales bacterium]|nr:response regulator transcription factor [Thermomicrobiales bacterium]
MLGQVDGAMARSNPQPPPTATILLVEDDRDLRELTATFLREGGYGVLTAASGDEAIERALAAAPDLILLDLILPGLDGFTVCREIRARSEVPIVVLSGRRREQDRVRALDLGADDYLTKPFSHDELLARVRAALRRPHLAPAAARLIVGDLDIDLAARRVSLRGRAIRLTPTEFALLAELARQPGRVVPQRELLQRVWGPAYGAESDYLYAYLHRLRRKLAAGPGAPPYLRTEPGVGYSLRPPDRE